MVMKQTPPCAVTALSFLLLCFCHTHQSYPPLRFKFFSQVVLQVLISAGHFSGPGKAKLVCCLHVWTTA